MATALQSRNSALAVMKEVTEGVPVAPTASSDYVALQDDFDMSPDFDTLENAEQRASIAKSKSIRGAENPAASFSHYLRSSGVEGQAPNYGQMLEAALGSEKIVSNRTNVDSSTTAITTLAAGEVAAEGIAVGDAFIILDSANGFAIRNVASIAGDALTWDFELEAAPANGVELSKVVTYSATQVDQPTLTLWHYVGNKGAIQMMSGTRPTSVAISITAAELINAAYSFSGQEYFWDPIAVSATNNDLDFTDDDGTFAVSIAVPTSGYYKDPNDVAEALAAAMNASGTTQTHTVVYNNRGVDAGKFTFTNTTGAVLSLPWLTGVNTATSIGATLGFDVVDDTGALFYVSDSKQDYTTPQAAAFDSADPLAAKANELFIGSAEDNICIPASNFTVNVDLTKADIASICSASGKDGSIVSERAIPITYTVLLSQDEADKFHDFHSNNTLSLAYHFGEKSGGNWVVGKSGSIYLPNITSNSYKTADADGLVVLEIGAEAFATSADSEVFINFL